MILKALDTLHISSVSSNNILAGQSFELDDHFGRQLIERGLAVEVGEPEPVWNCHTTLPVLASAAFR